MESFLIIIDSSQVPRLMSHAKDNLYSSAALPQECEASHVVMFVEWLKHMALDQVARMLSIEL